MIDLSGKTVLITGASRGIGAEAARVFASAGAKVALLARSKNALDEIAVQIGDNARAISCDLSNLSDLKNDIDTAKAAFGPIDILINNAGMIDPIAPLQDTDPDQWSKLIDVNVKAVYYAMRLTVPDMIARGGGTVLTVSSGAAHRAIEGWSAYCASKAAVAMLTESLHLEESGNGIRAMGLSPGTVATQMQRDIKASGINAVSKLDWSDHIPPDWPARALLWMCSAAADPLCGTEVQLRDDTTRRQIGLIS